MVKKCLPQLILTKRNISS